MDTVKKTTPINNKSCLEIWKLMQLLSLQYFLPYSNSWFFSYCVGNCWMWRGLWYSAKRFPLWVGDDIEGKILWAFFWGLWMTLKAKFVIFLLWFVDDIKGNCELSFVCCRSCQRRLWAFLCGLWLPIECICESFNVMANASMLVKYFNWWSFMSDPLYSFVTSFLVNLNNNHKSIATPKPFFKSYVSVTYLLPISSCWN